MRNHLKSKNASKYFFCPDLTVIDAPSKCFPGICRLKLFVDPVFFWLHIPGGALFGTVFAANAVLMLLQMWGDPDKTR